MRGSKSRPTDAKLLQSKEERTQPSLQRKHVSQACDICRRRRIKCDAKAPCSQCVKANLGCTYQEGAKRGDLRNRRLPVYACEELQRHQAVLQRLVESIQGDTSEPMLRALKEGMSLSDLVKALEPSQISQTDQAIDELYSSKLNNAAVPYANLHPGTVADRICQSRAGDQISTARFSNRVPAEPQIRSLPVFPCDPYHLDADDALSKTILSFRNSARCALQRGFSGNDLIGSKLPDLELLFRARQEGDPHTVWTFACELAKSYPASLTIQLRGVFFIGLQMRFFINPCEETYNDLPVMLRPTLQQYREPHPAGVDLCYIPPLKQYLLSRWDGFESLLEAGEFTNWPYSDRSCLAQNRAGKPTLSMAFIEHISNGSNASLGPKILELVPDLAPYVRDM